MNGARERGIDTGLEYKKGAESGSQKEVGKDSDADSRRGASLCIGHSCYG